MASIFKGKETVKLSSNTTATGEPTDFVIHGSPRDVLNYSRSGNDLTIQMNDGHVYHIQNYGGHGFDFNNLVFSDGVNKVVVNLGPAVASVGDGILEGLIAETAMNASLSASALLGILGAAGGGVAALGAGGGEDESKSTKLLDLPTLTAVMDDVGTITGSITSGGFTNDISPLIVGTIPSTFSSDMIVQIMRDGATIGTATVSGSNWSYQDSELVDGQTYGYTARIIDTSGNKSYTTQEISITVDTTVPDAPTLDHIADNVDPVTGYVQNNGSTNDTSPLLTGSLTAELASGEFVEVLRGNDVVGTATVTGTEWSYQEDGLADGQSYTYKVRVTDAAGNSSAETASVTINVVTTAPDAPTIDHISDNVGSITGYIANGGVTNDTSPLITGSLTAELADGESVEVLRDGDVIGTATVSGTGWSYQDGDRSDGVSYSYTAHVKDAAGNISSDSSAFAITIDTTVPAAPTLDHIADNVDPVTGYVQNNGSTNDTSPLLTGSLTAELASGEFVEVLRGNNVVGTATVTGTEWSYQEDGLADGQSYTYKIRVTDAAGNSSAETASVTINVVTTAPDAPTIDHISDNVGSITGYIENGGVTNDTSPLITGSLTAAPADGAIVEVLRDGDVIGTATVSGTGWSYQDGDRSDGVSYSYTAHVKDAAGNVSSDSSAFAITIDTTAPDIPTINQMSNDTGTAGDFTTSADSIVLSGFVSANTIVEVLVGGTSIGTVVADSTGVWQSNEIDLTNLAVSASLNVSVRSIDNAGNASAATTTSITKEERLSLGDIDLSSMSPSAGTIIQGNSADGFAGYSVHGAGDLNGDGIDDIVVGVPGYSAYTGAAYVVFGSSTGLGTVDGTSRSVIDLSSLTESHGFKIVTDDAMSFLGGYVSTAGDVNHDGIADIIVGAFGTTVGGNIYAGSAYVIFGSSAGFGADDGHGQYVVNVTELTNSHGFIVQGVDASGLVGISATSAGDLNGDGIDDIIIGSLASSYVVFGSTSQIGTDDLNGRSILSVEDITSDKGFIIHGPASDKFGLSVSSAGDINGDGYSDIIIGASDSDTGGNNAGASYVIYGSNLGFGTDDGLGHKVIDVAALTSSEGFVIVGDQADGAFGYSVSAAGDLNGDGIADIIVGSSHGTGEVGAASPTYVIFGSTSGLGQLVGSTMTLDLATLSASEGFIIQGAGALDNFGVSVSSAGDVNGDGIDDLIIGAALNSAGGASAGAAYVIYGSTTGFGTEVDGHRVIDVSSMSAADGFRIQGDAAYDQLGLSVSAAGDVNSDGYADLIVGAAYGDDGQTDAGEAYIIYGKPSATGHVVLGTSEADFLAGTDLSDNLSGAGGADVLLGYGGDDTLTISDTNFKRIDGGEGHDTLVLDGVNLNLDLTSITGGAITGVEQIDISGTGANTINVSAQDVFNISSGTNRLVIDGDSDDIVYVHGFTSTGSEAIDNHTYNVYTATLVIDQDITNVFPVV